MSPRESMESPLDPTLKKTNAFDVAELPPAPRSVSALATLTLLLKSTPSSGFGQFFLTVSMIFVLVFCGFGKTGTAIYEKLGTWEPYADGVIVSCESTGVSVNERQCQAIRFSGQSPDDSSSFEGVSYTFRYLDPGEEVAIERKKGTRDVLRVEGTSIAGFGSLKEQFIALAFLSIFFLIGAIMGVILPLREGLRTLKILKNGDAAYGSYDKTDYTGARINDVPVCKVSFNYVTSSFDERVAVVRTLDPQKLIEQPNYPLLYLPDRPKDYVLLNSLPDGVTLKPNEGFQASFRKLLPRLILATIIIAEFAATYVLSTKIDRAVFSVASAAEAPERPGESGDVDEELQP
ncbi:MAG: hypothetical protein IJM54_03320 [Thermoguttaceae bacterium]|nr:hypothetical protein [Thermoguttaceae bacterium]